jgi:hypothetical protein
MSEVSDFGWDNSGNALPHSSGVVRLEVTIFPSLVPLRKRIRQHYAFQFNSFTIQQIPSNQIENLETIPNANGGEIGITLKKKENFFNTICGILYPGASIKPSRESDSILISSNKPTKEPEYSDRVGGKFYIDGTGDLMYRNQAAKKAHQTFVANGSLFSTGFNTVEEAARYAQIDSNTSNSAKYQFYSSLVSSPGTTRIPHNISESQEDSSSQSEKSNSVSVADSELISGNPNGASFHKWLVVPEYNNKYYPLDQDLLMFKLAPSVENAKINGFLGYVGPNNVYVGNVVEAMRQAEIDPETENDGIKFDGSFSDYVSAYSYWPPGVHCSFIKSLPIFPGEDFSVRFKKLATTHPIAIVEDETSGPVRWKMQDQYRFIDSGSFHKTSSGFFNKNFNPYLTANYAVCPPAFADINTDGKFDTERKIPDKAQKYYLANQPYVVIEIDAGVENRYFLIIPERASVIMVEVTSDYEISDFIDDKGYPTKIISKKRIDHSRVIHDFGFSGSSLLSLDSFTVHFQHYRGALNVTFDPMQRSGVVTRKRFGNNLPSEVFLLKEKLTIDDPLIKDKINPETIPIKLAGAVQVHMGHVKMCFNFSPITYPEGQVINISYPVGIQNLDGNLKALNVLLRSAGGFEEGEKVKKDKKEKFWIKDERGRVIPGQSRPNYSQFASEIYEVLSGEFYKVPASLFSQNQLMAITGPSGNSDPAWNTRYGNYSKPSAIYASANGTDAKEYVNRIHPYITLLSGNMTFTSPSGSWTLEGATRPICQGFSVFVPEGPKPAWEGVAADVTANVMEFSDNWERSDRNFLSHNGSIKFYLNKSDALPILENITAVETEKGSLFGDVRKASRSNSNSMARTGEYNGDQTSLLANLQDRYFYIEVRAWRDPYRTKSNGVGANPVLGNSGPSSLNNAFYGTYKNEIPNSDNTLMFTGFCRNSRYSITDSHIEMNCKLEDYWSMLDSMNWLNPPFYDAMRDYDAVMDVMQRAGFFYERSSRDPAFLIHKFVTTPSDGEYYEIPYDGSKVIANDYVLPGSYNTMNQPIFRPEAGTGKYSDTLRQFAGVSGKTVYFDRRGVMHFDVPPDELEIMQMDIADENRNTYKAPVVDVFSHTYTRYNGAIVPWWNIIIDNYSFERAVQDIVNEVRVISSTPEGTLVSAAHMNRASMSDIDLPGFIGFRKMFLQKSGYFGSGAAVRKQVERYTTMFNAPIIAGFNILGRVGMQAGETILVDGPGTSAPYRLLVTNVSNKINPKDNQWIASVQGRYFIPGEKIKFTGTTITLGAGGG